MYRFCYWCLFLEVMFKTKVIKALILVGFCLTVASSLLLWRVELLTEKNQMLEDSLQHSIDKENNMINLSIEQDAIWEKCSRCSTQTYDLRLQYKVIH